MRNILRYVFIFLVLAIFIVGCGKKEEPVVNQTEPVVVVEPEKPSNLITVCQDGSCDYNSLSAAVDIAESGKEIKIMDKGTYLSEEVILDVGSIIIDCNGATLQGEGQGTAFFYKESNNNEVKNCVIDNYAQGANFDRANENKLIGNKISGTGLGIYLKGSNNNEIKNNEVTDSKEGISLYACEGNVIEGNTVSGMVASGVVDTNSLEGNKYINNVVKDNVKLGFWIKSSNIELTRNTITGNGMQGILCSNLPVVMSGNSCSSNEGGACKNCPADSCTDTTC